MTEIRRRGGMVELTPVYQFHPNRTVWLAISHIASIERVADGTRILMVGDKKEHWHVAERAEDIVHAME